jgi:hypothetical protein
MHPMQLIVSSLTCLFFIAHAALGCIAHRTCEHHSTIAHAVAEHADHDCTAHHDHHDSESADDDHSPDNCSHSDCSYVKADTQRLDVANAMTALLPALVATDSLFNASSTSATETPLCRADLSPTQLYVWHCALII